MGHKSGRETLYWYGNLDSFHTNYRDTLFKTIFEQMVLSAGSVEALVVQLKATKWVSTNAAAYTCGGKCGPECRHFYQPRTRKTFNKILADQKVSFMCITKTVPCKWHDNYEKWCAELTRELAKTGAARKPRKILELKQNKSKCELHFRQYETQRRYYLMIIIIMIIMIAYWHAFFCKYHAPLHACCFCSSLNFICARPPCLRSLVASNSQSGWGTMSRCG